jgi:hypothetical protein
LLLEADCRAKRMLVVSMEARARRWFGSGSHCVVVASDSRAAARRESEIRRGRLARRRCTTSRHDPATCTIARWFADARSLRVAAATQVGRVARGRRCEREQQLRELTIQSRMVAARRPNEDLNNFISMKARLLEGPARSASPTEQLRKMLPSIADHSEDAHADGELHETRRRSTLKGVDRAKRDEMIDAWASKQAAMRRAMQAVPSIRDFYEPPPESPPRDRKVYAPADLR